MSRPPKCRRIVHEPDVTAFKPVGVPARDLPVVELGLDEMEAIRLADLEGLYQDAAAERMGVSRPTFGRLLERARNKVATALLGSCLLVMRGGPVVRVPARRRRCGGCGNTFEGDGRRRGCPDCRGRRRRHRAGDAVTAAPAASHATRGEESS